MYKRLLLACDQSRESLVALREGALIAQMFRAKAHLLIIDRETPETRMAEGVMVCRLSSPGAELLDLGLRRLDRLGVSATGDLARGEAARLIADRVRTLRVDLIVLGHRRQSFIHRWWSGSRGGYIIDEVPCSILIARDTISDREFERHMREEGRPSRA